MAVVCQGGAFVNLDFNSPSLSNAQTDVWTGILKVPPEDALRGWSMQWDWTGSPLALPAQVGTINGDAPFGLSDFDLFVSGGYMLSVDDHWSYPFSSSLRPTFHLYQVGTVPMGATQLPYYYSNPPFPALPDRFMRPYINGILQPLTGLLDVSAFAGQEVKLEFVFPGGINHYYSFDINGFVPEPSTWALLGLGGLALWLLRRRK